MLHAVRSSGLNKRRARAGVARMSVGQQDRAHRGRSSQGQAGASQRGIKVIFGGSWRYTALGSRNRAVAHLLNRSTAGREAPPPEEKTVEYYRDAIQDATHSCALYSCQMKRCCVAHR